MHRPRLQSEAIAIATFVVLVWPSTAWANPLIHPIAVVWPGAWFMFIPVVLVEAAVAIRVLEVKFLRGLWLSFLANLLSTAIGIPIGTCLNPLPLVFLGDFANSTGLASSILFLASLFGPLYLLAVLAEGWVARRFVDRSRRKQAWRWAWIANGATYGFIVAVLLGLTAVERKTHSRESDDLTHAFVLYAPIEQHPELDRSSLDWLELDRANVKRIVGPAAGDFGDDDFGFDAGQHRAVAAG
jgi:hypothetical protein